MAIPSAEAPKKRKKAIPGFAQLQRVGRSLMLPIAVLPAAALLMRFVSRTCSAPMGSVCGLAAAGDGLRGRRYCLFDNLPLIFAVGGPSASRRRPTAPPRWPPSSLYGPTGIYGHGSKLRLGQR